MKKETVTSPSSKLKNIFRNLSCGVLCEEDTSLNKILSLLTNCGVQKEKISCFNSIEDFLKLKNITAEIFFLATDDENPLPTIQKVRKKLPTTPIVVTTGNFRSDLIPEIFAEGVSDYIDTNRISSPVLEKVIFLTLKKPLNITYPTTIVTEPKTPERFKVLFDNSLAAILFTKPDGSILNCNDATVKLCGYSKEEILTHGRRLFIDHTDPDLHAHFEQRRITKHSEGELKVITKNGEKKCCLFSSSLFIGSDGEEYSTTILIDITERKNANIALRESEERFKSLIQNGSDMIAILDQEGNYTYVSPSSKKIVQIAPEELIGKSAFELIHPEDKEDAMKLFHLLGSQREVKISALRFKDGNGNWQWIETIATNLMDQPHINGIVINSRVVTSSIELKQQLNFTVNKLQNIMDSSLDMIATIDKEGKFSSVSKASQEILGYKPEELKGVKFIDLVHDDDKEITLTTSEEIKNGKRVTNFENRYIKKDGTVIPLIWSAYWNKDRQKMFTVARDGTERKKADAIIHGINEELRLSNERYLYSLKASNETIWVFDISTEEILWSDSVERNFGYQISENKEHISSWAAKIHPDDRERVLKSFREAACNASDNFWHEEYKFYRKNGEISHVLDRGYIIRSQSGKPLKIVGALLDMTENRKKSLEIEEKNKELMEITWMQSHLVRAPLARIMGLIDIMDITKDEKAINEAFEYLKISAKELDAITKKIVQKSEQVKK